MHRPESWGFLQFSAAPVNSTPPERARDWAVRSAAMALYRAQHSYSRSRGEGAFAGSADELLEFTDTPWALDGTCFDPPEITLTAVPLTGSALEEEGSLRGAAAAPATLRPRVGVEDGEQQEEEKAAAGGTTNTAGEEGGGAGAAHGSTAAAPATGGAAGAVGFVGWIKDPAAGVVAAIRDDRYLRVFPAEAATPGLVAGKEQQQRQLY